eukprot:7053262-Pyramimonas_sp.AAC.1
MTTRADDLDCPPASVVECCRGQCHFSTAWTASEHFSTAWTASEHFSTDSLNASVQLGQRARRGRADGGQHRHQQKHRTRCYQHRVPVPERVQDPARTPQQEEVDTAHMSVATSTPQPPAAQPDLGLVHIWSLTRTLVPSEKT